MQHLAALAASPSAHKRALEAAERRSLPAVPVPAPLVSMVSRAQALRRRQALLWVATVVTRGLCSRLLAILPVGKAATKRASMLVEGVAGAITAEAVAVRSALHTARPAVAVHRGLAVLH